MKGEQKKAPTYREMSELLELMAELNPAELRRCADEIIGYASDEAIKEMYEERRDPPRNYYEEDPGVVTYRQ